MVGHARDRLVAADWRDAIEILKRVLTDDPEHANAHAVLALALVAAKRIGAAESEARLALSFDGGSAYCHYAAAAALHARRKLDEAWSHCQVAMESPLDPDADVAVHILGAKLRRHRHERAEARAVLEALLERMPTAIDARIALAQFELADGRRGQAAGHAALALRDNPRHVGAHVVAGMIDLVQHDLHSAITHARFALTQSPSDRDAIRLWTSIKARRSRTLSPWWRFNRWITQRSEDRQTGLLIGIYVLAQLGMILAIVLGFSGVQSYLLWAWAAFCIYTWYAPVVFEKLIARDLAAGARDR